MEFTLRGIIAVPEQQPFDCLYYVPSEVIWEMFRSELSRLSQGKRAPCDTRLPGGRNPRQNPPGRRVGCLCFWSSFLLLSLPEAPPCLCSLCVFCSQVRAALGMGLFGLRAWCVQGLCRHPRRLASPPWHLWAPRLGLEGVKGAGEGLREEKTPTVGEPNP